MSLGVNTANKVSEWEAKEYRPLEGVLIVCTACGHKTTNSVPNKQYCPGCNAFMTNYGRLPLNYSAIIPH